MLEFKNVSVRLSADLVSMPFSLEMDGGVVACLSGDAGSGKSQLLLAILGLAPLESGYITLDGELVTRESSAYFRNMIAYVPQRMPSDHVKVQELFEDLLGLRVAAPVSASLSALPKRWEAMGLPTDLLDQWTDQVAAPLLRTAMLAVVPLLRRPIVLLDDPAPQAVESGLVGGLASSGVEVLYATRHDDLPCHKIVKI